ncbi:MAG: pitrilysin family protein [Rikenellaceae bacterium]
MINYQERVLDNGLRILAERDRSSKLAAINLLYCVGARNEDPQHTGFAHLFEHLMFKGTERFPSFDREVQLASGENNAFTNNDYTDFYITLPKVSTETALALEADRMRGLQLTQEVLETEKRVVIEEFKQRYLNQPYGDMMMILREMCYTTHPYRWATIGISPDHIASATMEQVKSFYGEYYRPSNAILSISADIDEEEIFALCERHFAAIADTPIVRRPLPQEEEQHEARRREVERNVPATCIVMAFHIGGRTSEEFFVADLVSDLLAGGDSGRLYQRLVKQQGLLAGVNAYVSGDVDPGLFVFTAQLLPTTSIEQAEAALWAEIERLKEGLADDYELAKVKNKFEASTLFGEINVMNKAMNMGFYKMIGDIELINREVEIYQAIDKAAIQQFARRAFDRNRSNTLIYRATQNQ